MICLKFYTKTNKFTFSMSIVANTAIFKGNSGRDDPPGGMT